MFSWYTATVNSVGPITGDVIEGLSNLGQLDSRSFPDGLVVVTLTPTNSSDFANCDFFVIDNGVYANRILATALAAMNTGKQVLAYVDWPPIVRGVDQDGNNVYEDPWCYGLRLGGTI